MHRGQKIVAWIPYGRERTVSILLPYLIREHERGIIDELWFYMNTGPGQENDILFAKKQAALHPWIRMLERPGPQSPPTWNIPSDWRAGFREPIQMNTVRAMYYIQDRNTVYVRFDDDIVWVHPNAVKTLVERKMDRIDDCIGVFPMIWNNAICSYMIQQAGRIPMDWGQVGRNVRDPQQISAVDQVGWQDPYFAERLHNMVLERIESGAQDSLLLGAEMTLGWRQQFSVSCFAVHGNEYADLNGILDWDEEEHWLTMFRTGIVKRSNIVCGMAQVSHFSFYTQRDYLLQTGLLDRYKRLSEKL